MVFNFTKFREVAVLLIDRKGGNKGGKKHAKLNTFPLYTAALYTNKADNGLREHKDVCLYEECYKNLFKSSSTQKCGGKVLNCHEDR